MGINLPDTYQLNCITIASRKWDYGKLINVLKHLLRYKELYEMTNKTGIYPSLDTPSVLLDLDQFESNVEETTKLVVGAGIVLRPHVKVHENAILAKMQIEAVQTKLILL